MQQQIVHKAVAYEQEAASFAQAAAAYNKALIGRIA